ncbi:MAG TPA: ABC transporter permease subunit, partial [Roseiarcus sp.]
MDFDFVSRTFVRLLAALPLTLSVWFLSVVLGALVAGGVTWMRVSGVKPLELFARAYVTVFRGTPLLIQLFVVYYGLASLPAVRASVVWPFLRDAFNCAVLS